MVPGIHIAFGHPYSEHTGQTWKSTTHIDCVGRFFDIWLDDEQVMAKGKILIRVWCYAVLSSEDIRPRTIRHYH